MSRLRLALDCTWTSVTSVRSVATRIFFRHHDPRQSWPYGTASACGTGDRPDLCAGEPGCGAAGLRADHYPLDASHAWPVGDGLERRLSALCLCLWTVPSSPKPRRGLTSRAARAGTLLWKGALVINKLSTTPVSFSQTHNLTSFVN